MKKLIILATVAIASFGSADSFAGGCRISPGHPGTYPVLPPPPSHHIDPWCPPTPPPVRILPPPRHECVTPPPVCVLPPPRRECRIKPCRGILPPPPPVCVIPPPRHECKCRITVCPPPPVEPSCQKCGCRVCKCHHETPVCRIKPCEPHYTVCRIKPCEHPDPGYINPPPVEQLPEFQPGQQVTIDGTQFGHQPGRVIVHIGELPLESQVTTWTNAEVRSVLPALPISSTTRATVSIYTADGQLADQLDVAIVPAVRQLAQR